MHLLVTDHLEPVSVFSDGIGKDFLDILRQDANMRYVQDFLVEDRPISPVGGHLTGSLAEPKATSLTLPFSYWQVCGL